MYDKTEMNYYKAKM